MALPGAGFLLFLVLRAVESWDESAWKAFAVVYPAYVLLYAIAALVALVLASFVARRFGPLPRRRVFVVGLLAGGVYVVAGLVVDPLWHERGLLVAWTAVAGTFALFMSWSRRPSGA